MFWTFYYYTLVSYLQIAAQEHFGCHDELVNRFSIGLTRSDGNALQNRKVERQ